MSISGRSVTATIIALTLLNIWRWLPEESGAKTSETVRDYELPQYKKMTNTIYDGIYGTSATRDIFSYGNSTQHIKNLTQNDTQKQDNTTDLAGRTKPSVTGSNTQNQAAGGNGVRLLGMLLKEEARHAFILVNGKAFAVAVGDTFASSSRVQDISETTVTIRNTQTNTNYTLKL